jgi:acetyl-CoA carboxylase carboxyl transferase subunit alpha
MITNWKQWEKSLLELEETIVKLKQLAKLARPERRAEIETKIRDFEQRRDLYIEKIYSNLSPWEKVLVARAEPRPYTLDYIHTLFTDFIELEGDRRYGADAAIVGGPARLGKHRCIVIGHQKGRNIQERQKRNYGMSKPEGYRKAIRLMDMANRFGLAVITFVDTPAADPGVESESRGISEAIASSMLKMFELEVPVISIVIGEGGSGGGIGIGVGNRVLMLEHSIYSVIPPEGCAAILWRQPERGSDAAKALKLTAQSAYEFKLIDEILPEPFGGAHRNLMGVAETIEEALLRHLREISSWSGEQLKQQRYEKFRKMGVFGAGQKLVASESQN